MATNLLTTVGQHCAAENDSSGTLRFTIRTSIEAKGDLPSPEVFVHSIQVDNDPKSDRFVRIGNVLDLTLLPAGRDTALAQGVKDYRAATFRIDYDSVDVAIQAKKTILSRIDGLINAWVKYKTEFELPASAQLPTVNETLLAERKLRYQSAKIRRLEKEAELVTASTALTRAREALAFAAQRQSDWADEANTCGERVALLGRGVDAVQLFIDFVADVHAPAVVAHESYAALAAKIEQARAAEALLESAESAVAQKCSDNQTRLQEATQAHTEAAAAVTVAERAVYALESQLEAATRDEEQALANVVNVCGTFDPNEEN